MDNDDGYRAAEYLANTHICPDCRERSRLVVRWSGQRNEAWCARCKRIDGFVRRETITQQWKRNPESVPIQIANRLQQKHGGRNPMTSTELALANEQSLMKRMDGARWLSQLTPQDKQALAQLAIAYHLDPVMGELVIYEGKPYIPLAGMIRKAHDAKGFEGVEDRPMTKEEREAYAIKQPIGWIAKVYRRGFRVPTVGTGAADPEKPLRNNPVERERPQWMARSRAIRQALRLAFPHSLPFDELESAEEVGIDPETGEIIDGIARELPTEIPPAASIEPFEMPEEPSEDDGEPISADLAATLTPEPQDEERSKADLREKIDKLATAAKVADQLDTYCQRHYGTTYADASLDSLIALQQELAARALPKARA